LNYTRIILDGGTDVWDAGQLLATENIFVAAADSVTPGSRTLYVLSELSDKAARVIEDQDIAFEMDDRDYGHARVVSTYRAPVYGLAD